jgi:ribonuclease T2
LTASTSVSRALTLVLLGAAALPGQALAQAHQCRAPERVSPGPAPRPDGPVVRTAVARYTFALSWSPEYCRTRQRDPGNALQCSGRSGRFGFIVHGLWPEAASGRPPQWCATTPRPSSATLRANLCMTPSPRLLEHEWAKHGSCMAKRPDGYFRVAAVLWNGLRLPDMERLSRQPGLTAGDLRTALVALNPGWRSDAIAVDAGHSGWLREVRLCYGRDFMPRTCPRGQGGARNTAALKIWRGL